MYKWEKLSKWCDFKLFLLYVNRWLHSDPISTLVSGSFWSFLLIWVSPLLGWVMFFKNIAYTVDAILRFILGIPMKREVGRCNASLLKEQGEKELAVLITSCDAGLGRDLTHRLADRGFIVFAACQTEHGSRQFYSRKKSIVGIKCDITKEEDVVTAANLVSTWLADTSSARQNRIPRFLHAVINNASTRSTTIGGEQLSKPYCGRFFSECFDISEYRRAMEVDFFGQISITSAFLPILKSQQQASGTRIINVSTVEGLLAGIGPSPYSASKFAMEAFGDNLRLDLKNFGIHVVTVNSSYHHHPMMVDKRVDYTDFYKAQSGHEASRSETPNCTLPYQSPTNSTSIKVHHHNQVRENLGEQKILINEILSCVELCEPPPRVIVGTDVKFLFYPLRLLPSAIQLKFLDTFTMLGQKLKF